MVLQGEVVEGAKGNMLTHAMVGLSSSDAATIADRDASESRLKYRYAKHLRPSPPLPLMNLI